MTATNGRVLIADHNEGSRRDLAALVEAWGYDVEQTATGSDAAERALRSRPDVVIADLDLPGGDGLAVLRSLRDEALAVPVLLVSDGPLETAVAAMKEGAYDYVTRPIDAPRVRILVERAIEQGQVLREVTALRRQVRDGRGTESLIGESPAMQEVLAQIEMAAPTAAPVLVLGESGVGKELVARTIHQLSPRHGQPFIPVNCSAVPENLLESELLGHERGAFTGAVEQRSGYFELANRGTIFLDEIAEMSPSLQAKYLRVLQDGVIRRVGGRVDIRVDVRVVAATNKDPLRAIREGSLRDDLYYRLNVFTIDVPPLRHRREDIPLLLQAFIAEFNDKYGRSVRDVDAGALERLSRHTWPGNVRELRNCVERGVIACTSDTLTADLLPCDPSAPARPSGEALTLPLGTPVDEAERLLIMKTLESVNNNKTRAAQILRISLKTLHNKLNRYASKRLAVS